VFRALLPGGTSEACPGNLKVDDRDTELDSIRGLLAERGIELRRTEDGGAREQDREAAHWTHETAERTLDSRSLFMAEVRRHRFLGRAEEAELARRIERGDYRTGYKFSTYATFWIRESIQRAIANRP